MSASFRVLGMALAMSLLLVACGGGEPSRTGASSSVDERRSALAFSSDLGFDPQTQQTDEYVTLISARGLAGAFMPDGRLLTLAQLGQVGVVDVTTGTFTALFIIDSVYSVGEKGAMDIELDPNFASNKYFYVYYSNGTTTANNRLRISRFTFGPVGDDIRRSEVMVWTNPATLSTSDYHIGGALEIGPDNKFYLTVGDGMVPENSQSLSTMHGKMLRINLDGTVPTDNPFYDGSGSTNPNVDEIYAYGLRNTFRFHVDRTTGVFWLGDVGGNTDSTAYEEVNILQRGANYGWPLCEGPLGLPKAGAICPAGIKGPLHSYPHVVGGSCCQNRSITGGFVYRGSRYPAQMQGIYVYGDYAAGLIEWLKPNADYTGLVASGSFRPSNTPTINPVWFGAGADGHVYYISFAWGNSVLRRIRYTGGTSNQPPQITAATATPTFGAQPLTVQFQGAAVDPDGDAISYSWNFGDGTPNGTTASPTHQYTAGGSYTARLSVTAGGVTVTSNPITITVGLPPTATITAPADNTYFSAGDAIVLSGTGTYPDTGTQLPGSALNWDVQFKHNEHLHPVLSANGLTVTLTIPTTGHSYEGDTGYIALLTATDTLGRTGTASITLRPNKVAVTVTTNLPSGGSLSVDGVVKTLPFVIDTIRNFRHEISVPASVCAGAVLWNFASWSDSGARTHTYTVPSSNTTLTATYQQTTQSCQAGTDGYQAVNGQVVFEAEGHDGKLDQGGKSWTSSAGPGGASGTYMVALDNTGALVTSSITTTSPRLDYRVIFDAPGTYTVWLRSQAPHDDDNSIHIGLNGAPSGTVTYKTYNTTGWTTEQHGSTVAATVTVPAAGLHTVNVWMREDGYHIDKFVLTTNAGFVPSGTGPAVSARGYTGSNDTTPPTVTAVSPVAGATGVALSVAPAIAFSEPVANTSQITLAPAAGGSAVPVAIGVNGSTVTLTPAAPLAASTTYRITVPTSVTDTAGNPLASTFASTFSTAAPAALAYNESAGMVVFEAEGFDANVALGGRTWTNQSGLMTALPNQGYSLGAESAATSPRMDYRVRFASAGLFRVWIRSKAGSLNDNSVHVGINGAVQSTIGSTKLKSMTWTNQPEGGSAVATIAVLSPGVHVVSLWMHDDGYAVDRVVLTTSATYVPNGGGPPVSNRN